MDYRGANKQAKCLNFNKQATFLNLCEVRQVKKQTAKMTTSVAVVYQIESDVSFVSFFLLD